MNHILTDATDQQLAEAVEANGVECCLSWCAWPGMERRDEAFFTWTLTDVPFPFFNNVFLPRIPDSQVDAAVESVLERARRRNAPMFWWTGPTTTPGDLGQRLMRKKGFSHGFEAPAMAVDLGRLVEGPEAPSGILVREFADEKPLEDWCEVMAPVYGFPDFAARPWYEILAHLGLGKDRPLRHFLGYLHDQPAAAASLYVGAGVAGVSSVATVPGARRQGLGTVITLATLREARRLGYQYGVLFSSPMGLGVYKKIGFAEYGKGNCYLWQGDERT